MSGIIKLDELLQSIKPKLCETDLVFCSVSGCLGDYVDLSPLASFVEKEGLTLVLEESTAVRAGLSFSGTFRQITLTVHSSLEAVGLTAAVASKLADRGISANVIAAYYHDHIFVQSDMAVSALKALSELEK